MVSHHLHVSIRDQLLKVFEYRKNKEQHLLASYRISSSQFGLGTESGSNKTPLGNFIVAKKIGENAPVRMIFKSRKQTGVIADLGGYEDLILTRILWLSGIEGHNNNTYDRFIYIHGTNQEALIGTPASHGCIRMRNADIVELFNTIEEGTSIEITV